MQDVFIIGSKGIPGNYGGYETFVDKLTEYHQDHDRLHYYVACKSDRDDEFTYHNATCMNVQVPDIGAAQAVYYDCKALNRVLDYIKKNKIQHPIVYVLACRIGPFARHYAREIHKLGGLFLINPDGHEFLRAKWPSPVRRYWKESERMMVRAADLVVCDSKNIEKYIQKEYASYKPRTTFIAYGTETRRSRLEDSDEKFQSWLKEKGLKEKEYYLVVGRFVPENNFKTMIREFMSSDSKKDFALITTANESFLQELEKELHFSKDPRIKFVGTVYDQELLMKIREQAFAYFHGHEVGGTNPSLLEALGATDLNLLLDVGFNREVAEDAAIYWSKKPGSLKTVIEAAEKLPAGEIEWYGQKARHRMATAYSWPFIAGEYEKLFLQECSR